MNKYCFKIFYQDMTDCIDELKRYEVENDNSYYAWQAAFDFALKNAPKYDTINEITLERIVYNIDARKERTK